MYWDAEESMGPPAICVCALSAEMRGGIGIRSRSIYEATGTVVAIQPATVRAYGNRQLRASSITEVPYTSVSRLRYCHTLLRHSIRVETYFCTSEVQLVGSTVSSDMPRERVPETRECVFY